MKNCIYPECLLTECPHGVNGEPHCQRSKPKPQPDYTTIIGIMIIIAFWAFIFYIVTSIK